MNLNGSSNAGVADVDLPVDIPQTSYAQAFSGEHTNQGAGVRFWLYLTGLVALGALGLSPVLMNLWAIWTNDPLRSIGMLIVPAGIILTLREWKLRDWELKGTWWGLVPIALAFFFAESRLRFAWILVLGQVKLNLFSPSLSLYLFGSGVVLLFAGQRLWRQAWLPLGLLLLAQPLPTFGNQYLDLPLQNLCAHIARSFAESIGFPPANQQLLRLMFAPDFGMFIAPGCDGLRGAVTLGYVALIAGYLKRLSPARWIANVIGAVLLGYLFNLVRLCVLVLYYRIAAGHPTLQNLAKQADYVTGGCLMLIAAVLFLWVVMRNSENSGHAGAAPLGVSALDQSQSPRNLNLKMNAFSILAILAAIGGAFAVWDYQKSLAESVREGDLTPSQLDGLLPRQLGSFKLNRAWQQEANGRIALETAAYGTAGSDEVILGVWLPPGRHSVSDSWKTHGEDALIQESKQFATAQGKPVAFETSFYSDSLADSLAGDVVCTPSACLATEKVSGFHLQFTMHPVDYKTRGVRAIPIFFRMEMPHTGTPRAIAYDQLTAEAQQFLKEVDFAEISRRFQ